MRFVLPAIAAVAAALYLYGTSRIAVPPFGGPVNATVFPYLLGIALAGAAILLFLETRSAARTEKRASAEAGRSHLPVVLGVVIWTALYALAFDYLGYVLSTSLYLSGLIVYFHREGRLVGVTCAVGFSIGAYLVMSKLLYVKLPAGLLF